AMLAVLYGFTAVTKLEDGWRDGQVLVRLIAASPFAGTFDEATALLGVAPEVLAAWLARVVGAARVVIALGYLAALARPMPRARRWQVLRGAALATVVLFHVGAEHLGLRIGWFGGYAVGLGVIVLAPARVLAVVTA